MGAAFGILRLPRLLRLVRLFKKLDMFPQLKVIKLIFMFVMVAHGDTPIYEAEFLNTQRREDTSHLNQFIIHAALDMVDECVWGTQSMHLKVTATARVRG